MTTWLRDGRWLLVAMLLAGCAPAAVEPPSIEAARALPAEPQDALEEGRAEAEPTEPAADAAEETAAAVLPPRPRPRPLLAKHLIGLDQGQIHELLGTPKAMRNDVPATVWRYEVDRCALDVFFYPDVETRKYYALSYEVSLTGAAADEGDAERCVSWIRTAGHERQG